MNGPDPITAVVGLRSADPGSGVGLFNHQLAGRLGVPARLLADFRPEGRPLYSLKFEELDTEQERELARQLEALERYALFLHTLGNSPAEHAALAGAEVVFCGNDELFAEAQGRDTGATLVKAFAPSLLPDEYRERCRPGGIELLYFGMAGKVDRGRFCRLRDQLEVCRIDYKLLCSLTVHQTSDGTCLERMERFFAEHFRERFIHLGSLTDMALSYMLAAENVVVGFYPAGVRANNTTFNTAWRYGKKIITNLDEYSPPAVRESSRVLDLDTARAVELAEFLRTEPAPSPSPPYPFTWERLVRIVTEVGLEKRSAGARDA